MEIYKDTGKLKTNQLSVTRPIGALLFSMDQPFAALTNETITAFIERANGNNTEILPAEFPLKAFLAISTVGNPAIYELDGICSVLAEICEEGSSNLLEGEAFKIKLDGLKAGITYSINGMEYPKLGNTVSKFGRKNLLLGDYQRRFEVSEQELMLIEGVDTIIEMNVAFSSGLVCKYTPDEIKAISRDVDAVKLVSTSIADPLAFGERNVSFDLPGLVTFPLVNEFNRVMNIDIKKKADNPINLFFKNMVSTF